MLSFPPAGVKLGSSREGLRTAGQKTSISSSKGVASWQGMRTKGQKKLVRGDAAKERVPAVVKPGFGGPRRGDDPGEGKKRKAPGKRPAVAARKEKAKRAKKG